MKRGDAYMAGVLAERRRIEADIEAMCDYEAASLPPGGTWISRPKTLAIVRRGFKAERPR